jgi:hypothetical protein
VGVGGGGGAWGKGAGGREGPRLNDQGPSAEQGGGGCPMTNVQ